jgi:threonine/homoserine/homoserine lactone efflux protein
MPVAGPIAVLVFGRGLEGRLRSGVYLACGAAIAESVYAYFAFWGIGSLLTSHRWIDLGSRALAAVILIALGARFAFVRNRQEKAQLAIERPNVGNKRSFLLGFTITALNPALIATWSAAVATLHSSDVISFSAANALPFSLGVVVGIASWFSILLFLLGRFRGRFQRSTLDRLIRVMGYFLIGLGLYFGMKFVRSFA